MEIKDRIRRIIEKEGMTYGVFAESIDVQQSTLSHLLTGRNKPSLDVIMKIHQKYTHINLEWLLYGHGTMTSDEKTFPLRQEISPTLFDENPIKPAASPDESEKRKEMPSESMESSVKETVVQEIRYIERPPRKIVEIRIYFDDNTYETFKNEK